MAVHYDVPFIANPNTRCLPASIGMMLAYFMPGKSYTMPQLEKLCGYRDGYGCWPIEHMLWLHDMGFELQWIEDFDHKSFVAGPEAYLRKILHDPAALEWQLTHSDLPLEAERMRQYLDLKLPLESRRGTVEDLRRLLDGGWLIRLEVNAMPLAGKSGYEGHSVLVIGYDESGFFLHNPDGRFGSQPNQHVSLELLDKAWREFGGSYSLYAFRKEKV